jgi:hypothetical protein
MLSVNAVHLSEDAIGHACTTVRRKMVEKFGEETIDKRLPVDEWARWSMLVERLEGTPSLLDIGVAHGTFLNALACHGKMGRMAGIDIRDYSLYSELYPGFERTMADVTALPYADGQFHTVTCMEVIEHLTDDGVEKAISEIRRVASNRVVISVPFCEGLPLYKGHFQRFTPDRIIKLFPTADYTLLVKEKKASTPWLIIEENTAE